MSAADRPAVTTAFLTLSMLLERGIPLPEALAAVGEETADASLAAALKKSAALLESGDADDAKSAFETAGVPLSPQALAMIEAGEVTGLVDVFFARLAAEASREGGPTPLSERALALRVLGLLLTAGIEPDEVLPIAAKIHGAGDVAAALREGKGRSISEKLRGFAALFPAPFEELLVEAERADSGARSASAAPATHVVSLLEFFGAGLEQGWIPLDAAPRPFAAELRSFYRLLHFTTSGRTFDRALELAAKGPVGDTVRKAVEGVRASLANREPVAEALSKQPGVFTPSAVALIRSVEEQDAPLDYVLVTLNEGVDRGLFVPTPR